MNTKRPDFIETEWPEIYEIVVEIEKYIRESPNIALIKLRQLVELMVKNIISYENMSLVLGGENLKTSINTLIKSSIIPYKFLDLLHDIRTYGNKAIHDNYSDFSRANSLFGLLFEILDWFACEYGERDFRDNLKMNSVHQGLSLTDLKINQELNKDGNPFLVGDFELDYDGYDYEMVQKIASTGNDETQFKLGEILFNGEGVEKNYKEAIYWFKKAAMNGNIYALSKIRELAYYDYKQYLASNENIDDTDLIDELCLKWYRIAANKGNPDAQCFLADMYYLGEAVEVDYKKAFKWYLKSAEQGHPGGQAGLGDMYLYGESAEGVEYEKAIKLFKKAAEQGDEWALLQLNHLKNKKK